MAEAEVLSTEDLRSRMFETLKKRGFVDVLKTQLRNRLIVELKDIGLGQSFHHKTADGETGASASLLCQKAVDSLIADHLKRSNYNYTLSIFLPEAGATQETLLPVNDVLQLLHISSQSKLYKKLISNIDSRGMLWQIISEISRAHGHPTIDTGCQTEAAQYPTISNLEEQLAKVDAHYTNLESTQLLRAGAVEERILSFQRQLEERYRSELNLAVARFKESELARVQIAEREQRRKEVDKTLKEMEQKYRSKYDALKERERHAVEQLQMQQEIAEKELFAQRQKLLDDIESLQQREVQLRRQQEIDSREKSLWEEKVKTREELAKKREESARRAELEHEQRVRDDVNRFKVEEQTRYVERLTNVEFRETRVKDNERRVEDQLQEISNIKVELHDKRKRVNDLEAELIRTRHELLSVQKQAELLGERTREMVDYQMLKEDNAIMRKELDNAKMRIAELMRDNLVERQKQEELFREMNVQAGKPTPEVALLRQQMDQLHGRHRTEIALIEQERLTLQQRLEDEVARNKDLAMKCEQQTWQQKQYGLEAADLRERLFDSNNALRGHTYRLHSDFDRSGSLVDYCDLHADGDNDQGRVSGTERHRGSPDDYSYSSDLVQDTKNRLRRLESEADTLEKNYRDFQFRVTSIDPILGTSVTTHEGATAVVQTHRDSVPFTELQTRNLQQFERSGVHSLPAVTRGSVGHQTMQHGRSAGQPPTAAASSSSSSDRTDRPAQARDASRLSGSPRRSSDEIIQRSESTSARLAEMTSFTRPAVSKMNDNIPVSSPPAEVAAGGYDSYPKHSTAPTISKAEISPPVGSYHSTVSAEIRAPVSLSASSTRSHSLAENVEPVRLSLDDAWKSTTTASDADAERRQREKAELEEYERQRKLRDEERRRREEEAWLKEQQALEELNRKQGSSRTHDAVNRPTDRSASPASSDGTLSPVNPASAAVEERDVSPAEPQVDPSLEKYMAIVKQQREREQKAKLNEGSKTEKVATPEVSEEDISVADENSQSSRSIEKDDFW